MEVGSRRSGAGRGQMADALGGGEPDIQAARRELALDNRGPRHLMATAF